MESVLERVLWTLLTSLEEEAETAFLLHLQRSGLSSKELIDVSSVWSRVDSEIGAAKHVHMFSKEFIAQLVDLLNVKPPSKHFNARDFLAAKRDSFTAELRAPLKNEVLRVQAVMAARIALKGSKLILPSPSSSSSSSSSSTGGSVPFKPLKLSKDCVWSSGAQVVFKSERRPPLQVLTARIPYDVLSSSASRARFSFEALAELVALVNTVIFSSTHTSSLNATPFLLPVSVQRSRETSDLLMTFEREAGLVPLAALLNPQLATRLLQSRHVLNLWCCQIRALLSAQLVLFPRKTFILNTSLLSAANDAFVSGGRLVFANVAFTTPPLPPPPSSSNPSQSSPSPALPPTHSAPPLTGVLTAIRNLLSSVFGLSRSISFPRLEESRDPLEFHLMEGATLTLLFTSGEEPMSVSDQRSSFLAIKRAKDSSGGLKPPSSSVFSSYTVEVFDKDPTVATTVCADSVTGVFGGVQIKAGPDSSQPSRCLHMSILHPSQAKTRRRAATEIRVSIFARPVRITSVAAAELLATLEYMGVSSALEPLSDDYLLTAACLRTPAAAYVSDNDADDGSCYTLLEEAKQEWSTLLSYTIGYSSEELK